MAGQGGIKSFTLLKRTVLINYIAWDSVIHRLLEWYTSDKAQLIKSLELKDRGLSQMIEVAGQEQDLGKKWDVFMDEKIYAQNTHLLIHCLRG